MHLFQPASSPLFSRLQGRGGDVQRPVVICYGAVPYASAKSGDVHFSRILRIWNYAVSPLEVKARDTRPVLAAIRRAPRGRLKPGCIEYFGVVRIDGHVINVSVAIQNLPPGLAGIF